MKKLILLLVFIISCINGHAQTEYSDQYLGWIRNIKASDPAKPARYDHRQFSAKQLASCNLFISWIQASYFPRGGLGEGRRIANEKLSPYNQYLRSLHDYYGAYLPTYLFLKKKPGGGWTPENNLGLFLRIVANGLTGDHVDVISSPEQYYFYIPEVQATDEQSENFRQFQGFNEHPVLKKYIHFFQPACIRFLPQYTVILSKNNQLPWIQISKGEFLDQLGKSIERAHAANLKKINDDHNEKRKIIFLQDESALYKKRMAILAAQLEKYKNRLTEKATIYTEQPSVQLENTSDLFEGNGSYNQKIPVYKYNPEIISRTKSGLPQWISITWGGGEMSDESFKNMHAAMLRNIDYDYIYAYFFDPGKINGKSYKPLHPPLMAAPTVPKPETGFTQQQKNEPGVLFFDDFSNTIIGETPANWKSGNNHIGGQVITEKRPDSDKKWAVITGQQLTQKIKTRLPEKFIFSCDIAVPKGYTWGAKRLIIKFGTAKASFLVSMRPGYDGKPGFLYAGPDDFGSTLLEPGVNSMASEIPIPGFSNNNPFNPFHLEVRKSGQSLTLLINNSPAFSHPRYFSLPAAAINGIEFNHSRSDNENEKYYVSGIKINEE